MPYQLLEEGGGLLLDESGNPLLLEVQTNVLLRINGTAKSFLLESLTVDSVISNQVDTCNFKLSGSQTLTEGSDEIVVSDETEAVRYFAGILANVERSIEANTPIWSCSCQDYTILLDSVLVDEVYENQTDAVVIQDLFTTYLPEIETATYVETGITQERIIFSASLSERPLIRLPRRPAMTGTWITGSGCTTLPRVQMWRRSGSVIHRTR